jgi:type II secretory pathway pseudopilin PulG
MTLLELVLVAAILAIVSAVVVPRFGASTTWRQVEGAARRVISDLNLAQQHARQTSTAQAVVFDLASHSYYVSGLPDPAHPGANYIVLLNESPYDVKIVSADLGGDASLIFDGYGTPDSGGTIVVRCGSYRAVITVDSSTGAASIATAIKVVVEDAGPPEAL